jgi:hypothetical protein
MQAQQHWSFDPKPFPEFLEVQMQAFDPSIAAAYRTFW